MTFKEQVHKAVEKIKPKLKDLAEGHVELIDVDETQGTVKVKLIGGRLC